MGLGEGRGVWPGALSVRAREQDSARREVRFVIWPAMVSPADALTPEGSREFRDHNHKNSCDVSRQYQRLIDD
jgi:hypothetical protein